jgi:hypothetical protein
MHEAVLLACLAAPSRRRRPPYRRLPGRRHGRSPSTFIRQRALRLARFPLALGALERDRQTLGIDERVDLRHQAAARATHATGSDSSLGFGGMLMHPHARRVDHLQVAVVGLRRGLQQPVPDARPASAVEEVDAGRVRAVAHQPSHDLGIRYGSMT